MQATGAFPQCELLCSQTSANPDRQLCEDTFAVGHPEVIRKATQHRVQVSYDLLQIYGTAASCNAPYFFFKADDLLVLDTSPSPSDLDAEEL